MKIIRFCLIFLIFINSINLLCACSAQNTSFTEISFNITDQLGRPVENAKITFKKLNKELFTEKNGKTKSIKISLPQQTTDNWIGTIISINADGYVPIIIFNFILKYNKSREAQFMLLYDDGTLPYCSYVEIPEDDEIRKILLQ